jgi:prevent-host-death family protein
MQAWQMQEAKARLSEVVKRAEAEGPQDITLHGHSVAVMLSRAEFDRLAGTCWRVSNARHPPSTP